ncbi:MAG: DUF975 family protein [Chitinispirillaceae bacterium]|jgi:uncharacterized membrane protein
MAMTNRDIMAAARSQLKGKWGTAILIVLVYLLIFVGLGLIRIAGIVAHLILTGAFVFGLCSSFLGMVKGKEVTVGNLFDGFSCFGSSCAAYLLILLFTLLWTLLLIVPGVIAALSYAMTFFILSENRELTGLEAIRRSKKMMMGNKGKLFCLECRFIGWGLLCIVTLGIGLLWIGPYYMTSMAKFYDDIRQPAEIQPVAAPTIGPQMAQ